MRKSVHNEIRSGGANIHVTVNANHVIIAPPPTFRQADLQLQLRDFCTLSLAKWMEGDPSTIVHLHTHTHTQK